MSVSWCFVSFVLKPRKHDQTSALNYNLKAGVKGTDFCLESGSEKIQSSDRGREEGRKKSACLGLVEIFYYEQLTEGKRGFSFVRSQQSMLTTNI